MKADYSFVIRWVFPWVVTLWLSYVAVSLAWPSSWWMEVKSVHVVNGKAGKPVRILSDRRINRPFNATWSAQVRELAGGHSSVICAAGDSPYYRRGSELPPVITLGWWTNGRCQTLPPGVYILDTVWRIDTPWLLNDKIITVPSNVFEITEP